MVRQVGEPIIVDYQGSTVSANGNMDGCVGDVEGYLSATKAMDSSMMLYQQGSEYTPNDSRAHDPVDTIMNITAGE